MKEIFDRLKLLADRLNMGLLANEIDKIQLRGDKITESVVLHLLDVLLDMLSPANKRMMCFSDQTRRVLSKGFIIMFRKDDTIDGNPTIVLNDFDEGFKAENNPVICMELVYDNLDDRDRDFDTLLLMKN